MACGEWWAAGKRGAFGCACDVTADRASPLRRKSVGTLCRAPWVHGPEVVSTPTDAALQQLKAKHAPLGRLHTGWRARTGGGAACDEGG